MKTTIFSSFVVSAAMVTLFACQGSSNNNSTNTDSTGAGTINQAPENSNMNRDSSGMAQSNTPGTQSTLDDKTHNFMNEAAMGGMAEVEFGKLAQEKAMNPRVKSFGEMMVRDHTGVNNDLKSIAQQKNVTLPADLGKHKSHYDDLSKKSGADFDKAYIKMMVEDHKDDIDAFEKIAKNGTDPDIKTFASQKLPTLRMHLDSAKAIEKSLK